MNKSLQLNFSLLLQFVPQINHSVYYLSHNTYRFSIEIITIILPYSITHENFRHRTENVGSFLLPCYISALQQLYQNIYKDLWKVKMDQTNFLRVRPLMDKCVLLTSSELSPRTRDLSFFNFKNVDGMNRTWLQFLWFFIP